MTLYRVSVKSLLIRPKLIEKIKNDFPESSSILEMRLGGETSIDIFPTGWDKSYALRFFDGYDIYFVGDRCFSGGNDFDIYKEMSHGNGFKTSGPDETLKIIDELIRNIAKQQEEKC